MVNDAHHIPATMAVLEISLSVIFPTSLQAKSRNLLGKKTPGLKSRFGQENR